MPLQLFTYRRVEDLGPALRGLPPKRGRVFLVAASGDRELLARLLEGTPHDYQVRRWDEIYRSFAEALAVKNPRVQLDPPDHWLLLHALMKRLIDRGGELPPGARRRGFLTLLGTQIRELIREDISPDSVADAYERGDALGAAFVGLYRDYLAALDEREGGLRATLNFGHTVGHAVEKVLGYGTISHGEAVAIGMVAAAKLGEALGRTEPGTADRLAALLAKLSLPTRLSQVAEGVDPAALADAARSDKKRDGDAVRFVFLDRIGACSVAPLPAAEFAARLPAAL